jgi:hypothetical protein
MAASMYSGLGITIEIERALRRALISEEGGCEEVPGELV